jgi:hypothetical protein
VRTGTLICNNTFTQTSAGKLISNVAGTDSANVGRLQGNTVNLDGEIEVDITGGYTPIAGDSFEPMTYTTRNGTFATLSSVNVPGGLDLQETYGGTQLTFDVVSQ